MHVNIKRLLSFLVVLAMVLSMTPVTGIPAIEAKAETEETTTVETVATSATEDLVLDSESKAMCAHCGEEVVWTAIAADGAIGNVTTTGNMHYYLSADNTSTGNFLNFAAGTTSATEVCLHLNGHNLNTAKGFVLQNQGKFNLLGSGNVKRTTAGWLFEIWTTTVNIYGGTYQTTPSAYSVADASEAKVAYIASSNSEVTLHNNATMDGEVLLKNSKLVTLAEGWTGSIGKLEVDDALWAEGGESILGTKLQVNGSLTGSIISEMHHMELKDGLLTKGEEVVFDAAAETNYCEHCAKYVTWTALNAGECTDGTANHYYVAADMTAKTGTYLIKGGHYASSGTTYSSVCLNLNGKTLTTGGSSNVIYGSNSAIISVMGDGTVVGNGTGDLIDTDTCRVNLYGGTYQSSKCKVMDIHNANSKVYLYNDAKFVGSAAISNGTITLNDNASIEGITISGGTVTAAEGWTGHLENTNNRYLELDSEGAWVEMSQTATEGVFNPKACGGYAYCEACGENVQWLEVDGVMNIEGHTTLNPNYLDNTGGTLEDRHYYLSADVTHNGSQWIGLNKLSACINLNGYTLTSGGRIFATGSSSNYLNIIAGDGGAFVYTGAMHQGGVVSNVNTSIYGGTYTSTQVPTDAVPLKPTIYVGANTINLYDVTVNGWMEAYRGVSNIHGTTSVTNLGITQTWSEVTKEVDNGDGTTTTTTEIVYANSTGKLVIDKDWTGSATLTVRDGIFTNGVISTTYGAATGDFTGTLKLSDGTALHNDNGTLMADMTFDPSAATNYCSACKAFVAWEALPETVPTIGTDGACLHYYVPADMTATGEKNAFLFVADSNGADVANVAPKVCLYLNNKTLTLTQYLYAGYSGVVNVIGDGTLTTTSSTLITPYTSTVNLYGGTYIAKTGGKALTMGTSGSKVNLYGDAELQGEAAVSQGALTLYDESGANEVVVSDSGKVTLDENWTGTMVLDASAVMDDAKVPAANAVVNGDALNGTVTTPDGTAFVYADDQLGIDTSFDAETGTGYCRACGATVQWEALGETWTTLYPTGTHYHYYLADDITNTAANLFYTATNVGKPEGYTGGNVGNTFCLYLNGKTLTLKSGKIYAGFTGGVVNVIGDGTDGIVTSTGNYVFYPYGATVNLYGGTYIASATGMVGFTGSSGTVYNIYENADLQGAMTVSQGKLNVYDEAKLSAVEITGGLTTFKSGWTGSAGVNAAVDLLTDNTINVANAYVEDGATGTLSSVTGVAASVVDHAIVLDNPDPDVFAPEDYNGYAFCPDCDQLVQWTDYNAYVAANRFHDANNTLSDTSGVITLHFYLSADLEYTTNVMSTHENVIFNLNGYNVTAVAAEGADAITAGYAFSSTQGLVLLNTAETMSTVTGWQTAAGNATVIHMGGGGASSWARLYDNVTLTTHEDCTTDAPVVHVSTNGGKFYMKGGVIDASKKVNNLYPTAVYVQGQPNQATYGESIGEFHLEGGEIKGGTSVTGAGAVQIGSRSSDATYLDGTKFVMTGGTISGGNANTGGNLLINKNCAEASITGGTISGGTAMHGGNIYCHDCDLTIGGTASIDGGTAETENAAFGGGGNIHFGQGTLTVEGGTITGGKVYTSNGSGGNIYLDKQAPDNAPAGSEVAPTHFIMTDGAITGGYVKDSQDDQNFGGNIRAYNVSTFSVTGGSITGGTGCSEQRANSANLYISYSDAHVANGWPANVTFGGDANIDGNVYINGEANLVLTGAPVIAGGTYGLSYKNEKTLANISGLTAGAQIELSEMTVNVPLTAACDNFEDVKGYITVIDSGATLTEKDDQLILVGVAIINGEEITWFTSNADAVAAYTAEDYAAGKYIQLGLDTALALDGDEYLIDLAGNVAGEVAITGTGTVHLFDSANADFDGYRTATVADTLTLVRDNNVIVDEEAIRYITVTIEGKTSAHALAMAITDVNLRTDAAGLYYGAQYKCDDVLAGLVSAYGVILSLDDMPGAELDGTDKCTVLTDFASGTYATSSSVTGIFKDTRTAEKNAEYGKMKIYVNAYIQLDVDGDGAADILVADNENVGQQAGNAWSLYDVLFEIDQNWADYADDQEAVKAFYDTWYDLGMSAYADDFENIDVKVDVEGGEGEGVTPEDTDVDVPTDET